MQGAKEQGVWLILRVALIILGVGSTLALVRSGLSFSLAEYLNYALNHFDAWLAYVLQFIEPLLKALFVWLQQFGVFFDLQPHWRHAFVVLWLLLSTITRATASFSSNPIATLARYVWGLLCALAAGILAGTVPLSDLAIFFWPAAALALYAVVTHAISAAQNPAGFSDWLRRFGLAGILLAGSAVGFTVLATRAFGRNNVIASSYWEFHSLVSPFDPSPGLALLVIGLTVLAMCFLFFGLPNQSDSGERNPGTEVGVNILSVLGGAAILVALSHLVLTLAALPNRTEIKLADGSFKDCADCPRMVSIGGGSGVMRLQSPQWDFAVRMGNPRFPDKERDSLHSVTIKPFSISRTEVTRSEFEAFVEETGHEPGGFCYSFESAQADSSNPPQDQDAWMRAEQGGRNWRNPGFPQGDNHPVVCVTWHDAVAYTLWLTRKSGKRYRLPSEAEWAYAAEAGRNISGWEQFCEHGNVFDTTAYAARKYKTKGVVFPCTDGFPFTAPVGAFKANYFGAMDMIGNAWEWTQDCESDEPKPSDGSPLLTGDCIFRIARGPSWFNDFWINDYRVFLSSTRRYFHVGFRVARDE
jgi:formylglycine-generating enzyme